MRNYSHIVLILLLGLWVSGCGNPAHEESGDHGHSHGHDQSDEVELDEVELTQAQMDAVGIKIGSMEKREMSDVISVSGRIEVPPGGEAWAAPRIGGTLQKILVEQGSYVRAGQAVGYVDAPQLLSLREDYLVAEQEVMLAAKEHDRQQALAAQGAGIRKNLEAAASRLSVARIRLQTLKEQCRNYGFDPSDKDAPPRYVVKAPVTGRVVSVDAMVGSYVDAQLPIAKIVDTEAVYCNLFLMEKDADKINRGEKVMMRLTNSPDVTFGGVIADITPVLDSENRSIPVKVNIVESKGTTQLIPGMAVSAQVLTDSGEADALPEEAVVSGGGKKYIFVLEEEHGEGKEKEYHFSKCEVTVGNTLFGYTAVTPLKPLSPDAGIVVKGAFYLNSMSTEHGEHNH